MAGRCAGDMQREGHEGQTCQADEARVELLDVAEATASASQRDQQPFPIASTGGRVLGRHGQRQSRGVQRGASLNILRQYSECRQNPRPWRCSSWDPPRPWPKPCSIHGKEGAKGPPVLMVRMARPWLPCRHCPFAGSLGAPAPSYCQAGGVPGSEGWDHRTLFFVYGVSFTHVRLRQRKTRGSNAPQLLDAGSR